MRGKLILFLFLSVLVLTYNAYAAEPPTVPSEEAAVSAMEVTPQGESGPVPQSVETHAEGELELLVKTYELPPDEDPAAISAEKTERGGIEYTLREMTKEAMEPVVATKDVTQEVTVTAPSDQDEDILPLLGKSIPYDVDGYSGKLLLDEDSITSEVASTTGYSYTVKEAREYTGLARNDPALIPKTVEKNGLTYSLADVQWSGGSENAPAAVYSATAVYTAKASSQKPEDYTVTALYAGSVEKDEPGNVLYTLVYEPLPAPVIVEPTIDVDWGIILWMGLAVLGAGGLCAGVIFLNRKFGFIRRRPRRQRYPEYEPEARPARRKPHALGYMKRDGGMEDA